MNFIGSFLKDYHKQMRNIFTRKCEFCISTGLTTKKLHISTKECFVSTLAKASDRLTFSFSVFVLLNIDQENWKITYSMAKTVVSALTKANEQLNFLSFLLRRVFLYQHCPKQMGKYIFLQRSVFCIWIGVGNKGTRYYHKGEHSCINFGLSK